MATANIFPADVLESISRLATISSDEVMEVVSQARELLAVYRENEDLITIGAYVPKKCRHRSGDRAAAGSFAKVCES